jgi:hypothetical protein
MTKFRSYAEPAEPMRGLEVPPEVVEALGAGKRPAVTITINGHSWKSRVAIMRGRYLLGLSNANRFAVTSRAQCRSARAAGPRRPSAEAHRSGRSGCTISRVVSEGDRRAAIVATGGPPGISGGASGRHTVNGCDESAGAGPSKLREETARDPSRLPSHTRERVEVVQGSHGGIDVGTKAFAGATLCSGWCSRTLR